MKPQEFDLIVGLIFLIAIIFGLLFGLRKMIYLSLAAYSVTVVALLLLAAQIALFQLTTQNPMLLLVIPVVRFGIPLLLIGWIIADIPGPRSGAGRIYGLLFALAWATVEISTGALAASPKTRHDTVEKSLTGPVLFAVGNAWASLVPMPDYLKSSEQPTT